MRGPIRLGFLIIALFFVGFGGWAALAPLGSAVVAHGSVVVDSKRKSIQHLESGIVREILVKDGEHVATGQVLVRLDDTQARTNLQLISGRYNAAMAQAARLKAEALGRKEISFPEELLAQRDQKDVAQLLDAETTIFGARLGELDNQTKILEQRDAQILEEIKGVEGQMAAQSRQMTLIKAEIADVSELLAKGLAPRPRLSQLQRTAAELDGQHSQNAAMIAKSRQDMGDTRLQIAELTVTRVNDAVAALGDTQKDVFDLSQQMLAARDVLDRMTIRAPQDGVVVNLAVHTVGGVINEGAPLMEIVPSLDQLVVEAHVEVTDIGKVRPELPAQIRLLAFSQRTTPSIDGRVAMVSADRIDDDKAKTAYYTARVAVDQKNLAALPNIRLYPGMPVDVMIETGKRTMLQYLLAPIENSFAHALREK
jgi:HlyD family secretion protein/epimerase transport system membrane fusion protein